MGSVNDFNLINKKALNYSKMLNPKRELTEIEKKRFGFNLLVIDSVSQLKDSDALIDSINDTEFCSIVLGIINNDEGIDAVTIDDETKTINLFNFKYRESYSTGRGQRLSDAVDSTKFLSSIATENTHSLDERTKEFAKQILERLKSGDIWEMNLYIVSNDNVRLDLSNQFITDLNEQRDLSVKSIALDDIVSFTSEGPSDIGAAILLDAEAVMTYEENPLSSSKSYLMRVPLSDLIRITCSDADIRLNNGLGDLNILKDVDLDFGILFENVRGFLGNTRFNQNIIKTLDDNPTRFFMYNNGVTMTTKSIQVVPRNGGKKWQINLEGFQVVNGGQTLRSVYYFKDNNFDEEKLSSASILVRVFQTEGNFELTNSIAEYTNSQNAISTSDLKSVSNLQIEIERYFKENNIKYVRKTGDTGIDDKVDYTYRISMERMAQIIFSKQGSPDKASNQKKRLFDKDYDEIFNDRLDFNLLIEYVKEYEQIKSTYEERGLKAYEQKYFYVLYLNTKKNNINQNIDIIEKVLVGFKSDEDMPEPRKLIQKAFKEALDTAFNSKS